MKKLKSKVFFTISSILTIFIFSVFIFTNINAYKEKKDNIENVLNKMLESSNNNLLDQNYKKVFMDFTVYNVILDESGGYKETVSHTFEDIIDIVKIKNIANKIIKMHNSNYYIGNLYTHKYAYAFTNSNSLIIMDNTLIKSDLLKTFITTLIIFIIMEALVVALAYTLTNWITVPVSESFEKQKRFIADASHELKTPLTVIGASCDAYFNDKNEKWIHNIKSESEKMNKLVIELLDLASLDRDKNIDMKEENLSKITEGEILTFESLFYEKNIKLKYDVKKNIKYFCNSDMIKELLGILIDNAIKHTKGKVIINLYKAGKDIVLEVKNDGEKIKKEDEKKIFERFYKVDQSRNRDSNRYGLGLAIAKEIVLKHNGTITASSKNEYTIFKVTLSQK